MVEGLERTLLAEEALLHRGHLEWAIVLTTSIFRSRNDKQFERSTLITASMSRSKVPETALKDSQLQDGIGWLGRLRSH